MTTGLMELLQGRRTYRRFDESRAVPQEAVRDILEAARLSSCASNLQELQYLVVRSPEAVEKVFSLVRWAAALPEELGTPKRGERPTLFILVAYSGEKKRFTDTDAGIAIANMTLAAWNRGIGSCVMGSLRGEALREALGLPGPLGIHSAIAFGYPAHRSTVVPVPESGELRYFLDENRDYYVPKKSVEEISAFY